MITTMTKLTHATGTMAAHGIEMIQVGMLKPAADVVVASDCVSSSLSRNDSHSGQAF